MISKTKRKELAIKLSGISCSAKDKAVFSTKNGIHDGISKTYEETGKIFSMTGEAVRLACIKVEKLITEE